MNFSNMKLLLLSLTLFLGACSSEPKVIPTSDPEWVTPEQTRKLAEVYIASNGFVDAKLVEEIGLGRMWRYRFSTNNIVVAETVVVDRKTGRVEVERVLH